MSTASTSEPAAKRVARGVVFGRCVASTLPGLTRQQEALVAGDLHPSVTCNEDVDIQLDRGGPS